MKHKIKIMVETEKTGLLGTRKVREEKIIEVDGKTYREYQKMEREKRKQAIDKEIDEFMLYDDLFDDE